MLGLSLQTDMIKDLEQRSQSHFMERGDFVSLCIFNECVQFRPEELGQNIYSIHGVFVLLVQDKVAEGVTVFGPEVFPWSFNWDTEKNRLIQYSKHLWKGLQV